MPSARGRADAPATVTNQVTRASIHESGSEQR